VAASHRSAHHTVDTRSPAASLTTHQQGWRDTTTPPCAASLHAILPVLISDSLPPSATPAAELQPRLTKHNRLRSAHSPLLLTALSLSDLSCVLVLGPLSFCSLLGSLGPSDTDISRWQVEEGGSPDAKRVVTPLPRPQIPATSGCPGTKDQNADRDNYVVPVAERRSVLKLARPVARPRRGDEGGLARTA